GGLVALGICLAYVTHAQGQGATAAEFVPVTMLITAAIFALAGLPTFLFLRERAQPQADAGTAVRAAFARLAETLRTAQRYRDLRRFLVCLVFYQAGIQAVIALAAIYAQQAMGFSTRDTLLLILVVNVTAAVGAFGFGYVQDRLGHVRTIELTLLGWIITVLLAWRAEGPALFRAAGVACRRPAPVRGCGESGRSLRRFQPVCRPRAGGLSQPAGTAGRVFSTVGAGGEVFFDSRSADLCCGDLAFGRRSPAGDPD